MNDRVLAAVHADNRLTLVLCLPTFWKRQPEAQPRLHEECSVEETVPGVGAEHHSIEPVQVGVTSHFTLAEIFPQRGDGPLDAFFAVLGVGVGRQPLGHAAAASSRRAHASEHGENSGHFPRVEARPVHVAEAQIVCLPLVTAPELEK